MKKTFLTLLLLSVALLLGAQEPLLRFGVIADAQYDRDTTDNPLHRHYALSRERLAEAVETFNASDLAFSVSLGDLVDRTIETFGDIEPILRSSVAPIHYVYGNHDYPHPYDKAAVKRVFKAIGQDDRYRSFECGKIRFILLNTNEIAPYSSAPGSKVHAQAMAIFKVAKDAHLPYAKKYNGSLSDKQLKWLNKELDKARKKGQKAIVMGHAPIAPDTEKALTMNAMAVRRILSSHEDTVLAYMAGHEHKGGLQTLGSIPCITFRGMCEGDHNRFAIVTVYENGLDIKGFGDQESFRFQRQAQP